MPAHGIGLDGNAFAPAAPKTIATTTKPKVQAVDDAACVAAGAVVHPLVQSGKRGLDVIVSVVALIVLAPLLPLIAAAVKLDSPGPVFFRQIRVGRCHRTHSELVHMVKFRTMVRDAEKLSGAVWAARDDPRITRVGRYLRKTRLDEVPQLWNVLRGEMSLIGPRPERPCITGRLDRELPFYLERTYGVLPGITGLAQVHVGYDASLDHVRRKMLHDFRYAIALRDPISWIRCDLSVLAHTFFVVVGRRGQ